MLDEAIKWLEEGGWVWLPLWYALMSLVSFAAYAVDKSAAVRGEWRIKESTLHLFELLGGWPGGFLAQKLLRHKNRKASYQIEFYVMVVLNLAILVYICSQMTIATDRNAPVRLDSRPAGRVSIGFSR